MTEPAAPHATATTLPPPSANGSAPPPPPQPAPQAPRRGRLHTRVSGMRTGLIAGAAGLIVVMIFIIQNARAVNISFLGAHLRLSLAVALFFAAIAGALIMAAVRNRADHPATADHAARPAQAPYRVTSRDDRGQHRPTDDLTGPTGPGPPGQHPGQAAGAR